jgi:anti-anti-sigma factor
MTADLKTAGRFDEAFAATAKAKLEKLATEARDISIDMSEASDIGAAGLGLLVALHKRLSRHGCKVRVVGANAHVTHLFERFQVASLFIEGAADTGGGALRSCFFGLAPDASGTAGKGGPGGAPAGLPKRGVPAVTRFDAASHSVKLWLDGATAGGGGELRGGDALKSYRRWARKMGQDADATEFRKHLAAILGPGRIVPRTSGYLIKGIQLRGAKAGKKQPAPVARLSRGQFVEPARMDAIAALSF